MKQVKLGSVEASRIVQGFWRLTDWKWRTDELVEFMEKCVELGVTTFDTAEIYANTECETLMGKAFRACPSLRAKTQIVSKMGIYKKEIRGETVGFYDTTYDRIMLSCKESLKRLNTDYLDVYLIHREDPCFDPWEAARALQDLKKAGFIREFGVSNFDPFKFNALDTATGNALVTNQIELNPLCFEHFNSGMMDLLAMKKIHPMIWSPLAGGRLFEPGNPDATRTMEKIREVAKDHDEAVESIIYAWLLYHPVQALPISGSNKIERLQKAARGLDIALERHEWYRIYTASGQQILR